MTKDEQIRNEFRQLAGIYGASGADAARVIGDALKPETRGELAKHARDLAAMLEAGVARTSMDLGEGGITVPHMRPSGAGIG